MLEDQGAVRVAELARRFGVAEETIRRDLDKLGRGGRLTRTHGGALSLGHGGDLPQSIRRTSHAAEKRQIAQHALEYLQPHDVVALDASTTVLQLAYLLPDMPLTVITYGLDVAKRLITLPQVKVICVGGEVEALSVCCMGPLAEASLRQFSIDKAFLSCKAIDLERGYGEASTAHASIKRLMMKNADCCYLLADHSKFGAPSMVFSGGLHEVDMVITDSGADQQAVTALSNAGVKTITVTV